MTDKSSDKILRERNINLRSLRIADIELFITAAYVKNLSKASKLHNLSQSAASTAITRTEQAMGVKLCTHEKRHFSLTKEALFLLPDLEKWLTDLKNICGYQTQNPITIVTTHAIAQISTPALLDTDHIEFIHMRPNKAYQSILNGKADIALVLDNAPWKRVESLEIAKGTFGLYSKDKNAIKKPILIPENQLEVLFFKASYEQVFHTPVVIKAKIASWSLIADICSHSTEVGYLPDFLAKKYDLHPVSWQANFYNYRILAIYKKPDKLMQERFNTILKTLRKAFG